MIADLCKEEFACLAPYFSDLPVDMLRHCTPDDIVLSTKIEHRLLMRLFVKTKLAKYPLCREPKDEVIIEEKEILRHEPKEEILLKPRALAFERLVPDSDGVLDLSHRVNQDDGLLPMAKVILLIPRAKFNSVRRLVLQQCNLNDQDTEFLRILVQQLHECEFVDISFNNITLMDNNLLRILRMPNVQYLDLSNNPCVSTTENDAQKWKKLIWLSNDDHASVLHTILTTHSSFYSTHAE